VNCPDIRLVRTPSFSTKSALWLASQAQQVWSRKLIFRSSQRKETVMNRSVVTAFAMSALFATSAFAADPSCDAQATEKKLAGAAKTSFVKKCQKDATAAATKSCEGEAADKKLAGAAKTSFVKKCVKESTAPAK